MVSCSQLCVKLVLKKLACLLAASSGFWLVSRLPPNPTTATQTQFGGFEKNPHWSVASRLATGSEDRFSSAAFRTSSHLVSDKSQKHMQLHLGTVSGLALGEAGL